MRILLLVPLLMPLALTAGCISTAAAVVKAPFQAAGQVADWSTTSQDEADRNYGRKMRKREAREGRERRAWEQECRKHRGDCRPYDGYIAGRDD